MRHYTLNEHFFDVIDTEEKAYFLGLLMADGFITDDGYSIRIFLVAEDAPILQRFADAMGYNNSLKLRIRKPPQQSGYELVIHSKWMVQRLADLGCTVRKSKTLRFPNIPPSVERHFIRGYFDGDGSIFVRKKDGYPHGMYNVAIIGTKDFCEQLANRAGGRGNVQRATNCDMSYVRYQSNKQAYAFCRYAYDGATVFFARKQRLYAALADYIGGKQCQ